jgi:hypothetical protein
VRLLLHLLLFLRSRGACVPLRADRKQEWMFGGRP